MTESRVIAAIEQQVAATTAPANLAVRLKVFVSYARMDAAFAAALVSELTTRDFEAFLDTKDIAPGEAWQDRLGKLIAGADKIIFVISPEAMTSTICQWELDESERLSKGILPVVARPVEDALVPGRLRRFNYVYMDTADRRQTGFEALTAGLRADFVWVREHTRLGELAAHWQDLGARGDDALLRGHAITDAELWISSRPASAPEPTTIQRAFIQASRNAEAQAITSERTAMRVRQRLLGALALMFFGVIVGLVGWINQAHIKEQWNWLTVMRPYMIANVTPHVMPVAFERALRSGDRFRECAAHCPEMIVIPPGSYKMGSPDKPDRRRNEPIERDVTLAQPFAIGIHPVTFDDWEACVEVGGCPTVADAGFGKGRHPVINVTWSDAKSYVAWLSRMTGQPYRLLTEAEYEYVARAGTKSGYPWGDDPVSGAGRCVGCGSAWHNKSTTSVGQFDANAFHVHDMVGHVWQWVEDCFVEVSYDGAPTDGSARLNGNCGWRVNRGGSWGNPIVAMRSANRSADPIGNGSSRIGFRVARTLAPPLR